MSNEETQITAPGLSEEETALLGSNDNAAAALEHVLSAKEHFGQGVSDIVRAGAILNQQKLDTAQDGTWGAWVAAFCKEAGVSQRFAYYAMTAAESFDPESRQVAEASSLTGMLREAGLIAPAAGGGGRLGKATVAPDSDPVFSFTTLDHLADMIGNYRERQENPMRGLEPIKLMTYRASAEQELAWISEAEAEAAALEVETELTED